MEFGSKEVYLMSVRSEKEAIVQEVIEKLEKAKSTVLTDYRGLNVAEATQLRKKLREADVEYRVIKNTMTRFAVRELGLDELSPYLEGPTAIAFSYEDPAAAPKILTEFMKASKKLTIKAGMLEGKLIDEEGVKALADLPSREILLSMVLSAMQSPIANWVSVLGAPIRSFGYALDGVRQQKEA
jgi:large subunit ribosomal protein L10